MRVASGRQRRVVGPAQTVCNLNCKRPLMQTKTYHFKPVNSAVPGAATGTLAWLGLDAHAKFSLLAWLDDQGHVLGTALAQRLEIGFADHAPIKDPDAPGFSVLAFDRLQGRFPACLHPARCPAALRKKAENLPA